MAKRGKGYRKRLEKRRPTLRDLFFRYRLIRYLKPYKKQIAVMLAFILIYAACHGVQLGVVRELLRRDLWLPPPLPPAMSIDDVVNQLPEQLEPAARAGVLEHFVEDVQAGLGEVGLDQTRRGRVTSEAIRREAAELARTPPEDLIFAPAVRRLVQPLDEVGAPKALRGIYRAMSRRVLATAAAHGGANLRAKLEGIVGRVYAPPERQPDLGRVRMLCLILLIVAVVVGVAVVFRTVLRAWLLALIARDVRNDLCEHIIGLDMRFFTSRSTGELISRQTSDIAVGVRALGYLFDNLAVQPFLALAYAGAAFYINWRLALVFLLVTPALFLPIFRLAKRIKKYGRQRLEKIAELTALMSEMFHGVRVLKAFRAEERKLAEFREVNDRFVNRMYKALKLKGVSRAFTELFANASLAGTMLLGSYIVITGLFGLRMDAPDIVLFGGCVLLMTKPVKRLIREYGNFMEAVAASERVFEVLDVRPGIREAPDAVDLPPLRRSIAFRDVSFAYDGPRVLEDITFEVRCGEVVAVVGHSGAGKSTLLDLIPRFYDPTSGAIEIDGVDIRKVTIASLRDQIALVSQEPFLFRTSIAENIRYGRADATDDEIRAAAEAANIHDFIQSLPDGYDTMVGERGVKLSGGQRQRITIARAILKDAPILLLDEATSSLDAESQRLVHDALRRLMEHRTTFVIAHRLSTVQHADKVIVLREGRLVETGTHAELLEARGEYWRLYQTEFEAAGNGA